MTSSMSIHDFRAAPTDPPSRDDAGNDAAQRAAEDIARHARYALSRPADALSPTELFSAVALSVRARLIDGLFATDLRTREQDPKTLNYLSIEYLMGRSLGVNLDSLGLRPAYHEALRRLVVVDRAGKALSSVALLVIIAVQGVSIAPCLVLALAALMVWAFSANALGRAYVTFTTTTARPQRDPALGAPAEAALSAPSPAALQPGASPRV